MYNQRKYVIEIVKAFSKRDDPCIAEYNGSKILKEGKRKFFTEHGSFEKFSPIHTSIFNTKKEAVKYSKEEFSVNDLKCIKIKNMLISIDVD